MTKPIAIGAILVAIGAASACGSGDATPPGGPAAADPAAPGGGSGGGTTTDPAPSASGGDGRPPASPACADKPSLSGDLDWTLQSGGAARTVHVHVPRAYDRTRPTPVVLNFHGFTSDGLQQAAYTNMVAKADEAGFVAVHADGTGDPKSWNAGACCGDAVTNAIDDVAFVRAILDELDAKLCIDDKRVFATGMSNGGFLSHRLACELSDRIAAIAPVAGVLGVPACAPKRPVSVMHFHGTDDPLVPYDGVDDATRHFASVADTIKGWGSRDGCTDEPRKTFDHAEVTCTTQSACTAGVEVTLCTVTGGGHTWPGAVPVPSLGYTTNAIHATDAMWDFFQRHPMP